MTDDSSSEERSEGEGSLERSYKRQRSWGSSHSDYCEEDDDEGENHDLFEWAIAKSNEEARVLEESTRRQILRPQPLRKHIVASKDAATSSGAALAWNIDDRITESEQERSLRNPGVEDSAPRSFKRNTATTAQLDVPRPSFCNHRAEARENFRRPSLCSHGPEAQQNLRRPFIRDSGAESGLPFDNGACSRRSLCTGGEDREVTYNNTTSRIAAVDSRRGCEQGCRCGPNCQQYFVEIDGSTNLPEGSDDVPATPAEQ